MSVFSLPSAMLALLSLIVPIRAVAITNSTTSSTSSSSSTITSAASVPSFSGEWVSDPNGPTLTLSCDIASQYCTRSGNPIFVFQSQDASKYWNPFELGALSHTPTGVEASCSASFSSSLSNWKDTAPITYSGSVHPESTFIGTVPPIILTETSFTFSVTAEMTTYTTTLPGSPTTELAEPGYSYSEIVPAYTAAYYVSEFAFDYEPPCCSSCVIYGGTVQVYHWPTPAPSPHVSTLVDPKNNFTFVSPSAYVAFQSLYATNKCGTLGNTVYTSTTIAFDESDLSTSPLYSYFGTDTLWIEAPRSQFSQISYGNSAACGDQVSTIYNINGGWVMSWFTDPADASSAAAQFTLSDYTSGVWYSEGSPPVSTYSFEVNPCSPVLEVPTKLYSLNELWTGCQPGISAFFDPPYTLTPDGSLSLTAFGLMQQPASTTSSVVPGPTVVAPTPSITSTVVPVPATTSSDPPAQTSSSSSVEAASKFGPGTSSDPTVVSSTPSTSSPQAPSPASSPQDPAQSPTSPDSPIQSSTTSTSQSPAAPNSPAQSPTTSSNNQPPAASPNTAQTLTLSPNNPVQTATGAGSSQNVDPGQSPSNVVSTTQVLPSLSPIAPSTSPAQITIGSSTIVADPSSNFVIASQTLAPGSQVTVSNSVYSLASNGGTLLIGNTASTGAHQFQTTQVLQTPASPTAYLVGSQTLAAGSQITISSSVYSLDNSGSTLVVGNGNQFITTKITPAVASPTAYMVGSQTLAVGGPAITVSGTVVSLGASSVVIGGSTQPVTALLPLTTSRIDYVLAGQTLQAGGKAITASGTVISLMSDGKSVVVAATGTTQTLDASVLKGDGASSTVVMETGTGIGGIIASVGGFVSSSTSATYVQYTGAGGYNGTMFVGGTGRLSGNGWRIWIPIGLLIFCCL